MMMPTTLPTESLLRRIRHAEQLRDCMNYEAWFALLTLRHEALNELIEKATQ